MDDAITHGATAHALFVASDGVSGAHKVADVEGGYFVTTPPKQQSPGRGFVVLKGCPRAISEVSHGRERCGVLSVNHDLFKGTSSG